MKKITLSLLLSLLIVYFFSQIPQFSAFAATGSTCSGDAIALTLNPYSALPSTQVSATLGGLLNCTGKVVNFKQGKCAGGTNDCVDIHSCPIGASGTGCSITFTSPSSAAVATIWAYVDINGNGNTNDSKERRSADLTISGIVAKNKTALSGNQDQSALDFSNYNVYEIQKDTSGNASVTINGDFPAGSINKTAVVFIDKDLIINKNIVTTDNKSGLVFVVKGTVHIDPSVTRIDAAILSEGLICTAYSGGDNTCPSTAAGAQPLVINGSLISINQTDTVPIKFQRVLTDNSCTTCAAEKIIYQPKYLVILRDILSDTYQKWSEIQ